MFSAYSTAESAPLITINGVPFEGGVTISIYETILEVENANFLFKPICAQKWHILTYRYTNET